MGEAQPEPLSNRAAEHVVEGARGCVRAEKTDDAVRGTIALFAGTQC